MMNKELTKEECLEALDILKEELSYLSINFNANYPYTIEMIKEVQSCFEQLINKHFYLKEKYKTLVIRYDSLLEDYGKLRWNPPLKFEELEVGMWVCDNKLKWYWYLHNEMSDKKILFEDYGYVEFEENRFFRYQVKGENTEKIGVIFAKTI